MDTIFEHVAGLDVHKKSVTACVRHWQNGRVRKEVRTFNTCTAALLSLRDWLATEPLEGERIPAQGQWLTNWSQSTCQAAWKDSSGQIAAPGSCAAP